jgi:hypothetical protein
MNTIDLAVESRSVEEILQLAEQGPLVVRTAQGKAFAIAEVAQGEEDDDFAHEVALTRQNKALRALLSERSKEPGKYTIDQVREKLGLRSPGETAGRE